MRAELTNRETPEPPYGAVRSPTELGALTRRERKRQRLTLGVIYSATGISTRFLSEFERGKPNASIGRVMDTLQALGLEMIVLPRLEAQQVLMERGRGAPPAAPGGERDT